MCKRLRTRNLGQSDHRVPLGQSGYPGKGYVTDPGVTSGTRLPRAFPSTLYGRAHQQHHEQVLAPAWQPWLAATRLKQLKRCQNRTLRVITGRSQTTSEMQDFPFSQQNQRKLYQMAKLSRNLYNSSSQLCFFRVFQQMQEGVVCLYRNQHQLIALHFTPTPAHTELFAYDAAFSFLRISGSRDKIFMFMITHCYMEFPSKCIQ